jgi:signal transduction histidine kinase
VKEYLSSANRWFVLTLFLVFLVLGAIIAFLFYYHGIEMKAGARNRIVTAELERSREQARIFAAKVEEAISRTRFSSIAEGSRKSLMDFRELTDMMMAQNSFVTYIHLQDENGETLLYKGPEAIQKVVVKNDSVTFMERTTENMSFIRLNEAGVEEGGIHDISTILHGENGRGASIGKLRIGVSHDRLADYSADAVSENSFTSYYSLLAFVVFLTAFGFIWFHFTKVAILEESLATEQRLAYVGGLASGLVHELRNPINSMNLNLSLLEEDLLRMDGKTGSSMTKILNRIKPGLVHLEHVSTEFLNFARPPEVELKPVSVNEIVKEVLQFSSEECRQALVEVETVLDDSVGELILDKARLRKILLNLVMNGIQSMPEGGVLTIETELRNQLLTIRISDTGVGMSEQTREKLFTLFYTTKEGGVGLGLPIVKRMVADLNGTIAVVPKESQGTAFVITIPAGAVRLPEK